LRNVESFNHVFGVYWVVALIVFSLVCISLAIILVHFRAGRGHTTRFVSQRKIAEAIYIPMLIGAAAFLAVWTANANAAERRPPHDAKLSITILAHQWCWTFAYQRTNVVIYGRCPQHDPTLVVPTNEVIRFGLISQDVIHEWWLPARRWKEEAFPSHTNHFYMVFPKTGRFWGRCSEFCGLFHDRMDFSVRAVTPAQFSAWLHRQSRPASSSSA
jgi:cytochrome c oxidase subunit 2